MSKAKDISDFEKTFTTQQTFRRNKHYYDVLKINETEHQNQIRRRKPIQLGKKSPKNVDVIFRSAKKQRKSKVQDDIDRYRFRMSYYKKANPEVDLQLDGSYPEINNSNIQGSNNVKGIPLNKMLSRQSLQKLECKPCVDQRQFNNFYLQKNDPNHTPSIEKYSPRNVDIALKHMNDIYYNSQKEFQKFYFNQTTNTCVFDLNKQNDSKPRYFFHSKRPEDIPKTQAKRENVLKSFSLASPFKPNKILHFYKSNGRELPSQLDQRYLSTNKNFYKDNEGKLIKPNISFIAKRYKDDMLSRDMSDLYDQKHPYFQRNEICDERYFKQQRRRL